MSNIEIQNYKTLLAKKIFWLFTGRAMPVIILFLITILYSRRLSYDDYGKFQSVWMYTNIINVFISFGITSLILSSNLSFLFSFIKRHLAKIISFYSLLWIIVLTIFFWYGKNFNSSTKILLIVFVIVQNATTVLETLQIKNRNEKFVFAVNFIYSILFFAWHYYVLIDGFILNSLIIGIIIITLVKAAAMLSFKKHRNANFNVVENKIYFRHWIYLGLNDALGILAKWIDKLFLLYLLTTADFAVFFNGSFEIPLFSLLVSIIGNILLIDISANIAAKENVIQLFNEAFRILSIIVFPLFLFLFLYRIELFAVIFKHRYDASIPVFMISIFILPARINSYSSILQCYSSGDKIIKGSALDIFIILILMLSLYPVWGTKGVALAIVIGTYCQVFYYLWHSAKVLKTRLSFLIPLKMLISRFFILLLIFGTLYFVSYKFSVEVRLIIGTIFTIVIILISLYFYFVKMHLTDYVFTKKN